MGGTGGAIFITSLLVVAVAAATLAVLLRYAARFGLLDYPDSRKHHTGAIPLVGGLSALAGLLAGAVWVDGLGLFDRLLLGTAVALALMGALDDRHNLRVRVRVLVQSTLILAMMAVTGVYVHHLGTLFGYEIQLGWFGVPFTLVAMLGLLNAFNLIDGIDGLASLLALVAIAGILLTLDQTSAHGTDMLLVWLAFALLPQLASNLGLFGSGGKCFLGDAGSTLLGYTLGWALIAYSQTPGSRLSPVGTLWCVAVPVLDTLAVMYRRARAGRSPFKPGRKHLHYLLMDAGLGARTTLAIMVAGAAAIWCLGALVRLLHVGAGSNLIAFGVILAAYVYATGRFDAWVSARTKRAAVLPAPISKLANMANHRNAPNLALAPIANEDREGKGH